MLKESCKITKQCYDSLTECPKLCCFTVLAVPSVWFVCLSFQVLVTAFFVYIPINHSIEDTPSALLTIIHSISAVFLGLIAWKVIVDPRGKVGTLSIISGALRKAIKEKSHKCKLHNDQKWAKFNDEEKLAEVLHHVMAQEEDP